MTQSKYQGIGKKQIVNVIGQVIQKMEAIEMTLNLLIKMLNKEKELNDYMTEQLGGKNELQPDETVNGKGNNSKHNENT
jgi:predicted DNA-binding protein YlxM (UPF0122 family)